MVGVPLALLLMQRDATVTVVHSKTKDPAAVCRQVPPPPPLTLATCHGRLPALFFIS